MINVKLMVRINQADKASILTSTVPKIMVPENRVSYLFPDSALNAIKLLIRATAITVETVIMPFHFGLTARTAIIADTMIIITKFINARNLKLFQ